VNCRFLPFSGSCFSSDGGATWAYDMITSSSTWRPAGITQWGDSRSVPDPEDDACKPVWPQWAMGNLSGGRDIEIYNRTQPFMEASLTQRRRPLRVVYSGFSHRGGGFIHRGGGFTHGGGGCTHSEGDPKGWFTVDSHTEGVDSHTEGVDSHTEGTDSHTEGVDAQTVKATLKGGLWWIHTLRGWIHTQCWRP
jgi:hypothetical protein